MRIIGGKWRGRKICAPKGQTTRPTTDRVREALFSALVARAGNDLGGGAVLDAFAGSGALGLEALSRGARRAVLVECDRQALVALRRNVAEVGASDTARVVAGDMFSLAEGLSDGPFALILLDPPYTLDEARIASALERLAVRGSVEQGAVVSWEHASGRVAPWPEGFSAVSKKRYGTTEIEIAFYEGGKGV